MPKLPQWLFKRLGLNRILHKSNGIAPAKWCIQQFLVCPFCDHEFDVIATNLKRGTNQGTIKVTQKVVNRYDKDKFEYEEITAEIPTPPYFGAMMESTENLDEHINCPACSNQITVKETHWAFGRS